MPSILIGLGLVLCARSALAQESVHDAGYLEGRPDAPVRIVEFADWACAFCAQFARETLPELRREWIGTGRASLRFIGFHNSYFRPGRDGARAAECAADQGAFEAMHDRLYAGQREWLSRGGNRDRFLTWAGELGLDVARFERCWEEDPGRARLAANTDLAQSHGIRATPTFLIGDRKVEGALDWAQFRALLEEAEARVGSRASTRWTDARGVSRPGRMTTRVLPRKGTSAEIRDVSAETTFDPEVGVKRIAALALAVLSWTACDGADRAPQHGPDDPQAAFWDSLRGLCGQAFTGVVREAVPADTIFSTQALVMHVRECSENEIRIPFHVGPDRSRTWVISRTTAGLRLKHDHRHSDGTPDAVTQYGGDTADEGTAVSQSFPADAETAALIPAAATNVWTLELTSGEMFAYALRREGTERRFRAEFDLTRPVPAPPAPWGATPQ